MYFLLSFMAGFAGLLALAGDVQSLFGTLLFARFRRDERLADAALQARPREWPAVSVLKPLHGLEPLLEEALDSVCTQDYPNFEIIFGVHTPDDAAIAVVERLRRRHPNMAMSLVIDPTEHGPNWKVCNLINCYAKARHDIIVISDSDIHVSPTYLKQVVSTLEKPGTELVTTLYAGRPANNRLVRQFGACTINVNFLPGVMMSRLLGRQDCLGATMALRRQTLHATGGLQALVGTVADDAELGRLIRQRGGGIAIAPTFTLTTVGEDNFAQLLVHELRWGRTVKNVEPVGYGLSAVQLPLFWATLCVILAPHARLSWVVLAATWLLRALSCFIIARLTGCPLPAIFPFLPVRDWLSAAIMVGSARGSRVAWRGRTVHIAPRTGNSAAQGVPPHLDPTRPGTNRSIRS